MHMDSNHQSSIAALQLTSPLPSPSVTRQATALMSDDLNDPESESSARSSCALGDACPPHRQDAGDVKATGTSLPPLVFDAPKPSDGLSFYPLARTPTPVDMRTIRFTSRGCRCKLKEVSDSVSNNLQGTSSTSQPSPRKRAASYFHGEEDWDITGRHPKRMERVKTASAILQKSKDAADQQTNRTNSQCTMPSLSDSSPLPTNSHDGQNTPNINSSPLPTTADMDTDEDTSSALPSPSLSPISTSRTRNIAAADEEDDPMPLAPPLTALPTSSVNIPNQLIDTYTALPREIKSYLMLHLLRRSSMKTLQFAHETAMVALRSDIIARLPEHLARRVLSFCDVRTLCRATAVSMTWKKIIDYDEELWKTKLQEAGFSVRKEDALSECIAEEKDKSNVARYQTSFKILYRRHHLMHLNWKANRCQRMQLRGHTHHVVTCLQFDEDKIVTGSDDCCVNIYDIRTGELKHILKGHEGGVWALQYVGDTLVTGSTDRTIRVWNMRTGRCLHILRGHASTVRCLTIVQPVKNANGVMEPKEPMIVSGSRDTTLRVWRLPQIDSLVAKRERARQRELCREPSVFQIIAQRYGLHPTERDLNICDSNWYPNAPRDEVYHVHTLRGHTQSVRALDAHGRILVSGSYDRTVRLWDLVRGGDPLYTWNSHQDKVYAVVIDAKIDQVISGSMDQTIHIFNYKTRLLLNILRGHTSLVGLIGLTPNFLVSAAADQKLRVWSPDNGENMHVLRGHTGAITSFQHDERKVISGSEGGVKMWDIKTGKFQYDLIRGVSGVWRIAFDERRCIAAVKDNEERTRIEVLDYGSDLYTRENMHA